MLMPVTKNPVNDEGLPEYTMEIRNALPAHFCIKIQPFSLLSAHGINKYETNEFSVGDRKWRLVICVDDGDHVSVHLVMAETSSLPTGWELNVMFSILLYNHISDNYLCFRSNVCRFHGMKSQWGIPKLISKETLMDPLKGYVVDDKCVIGAELYVIRSQHVTEHLLLKQEKPTTHEFIASGISKVSNVWISEEFTVGGCKWKVRLYPKGNVTEKGRNTSIFLYCVDFSSYKKMKVDYVIGIKNQIDESGQLSTRAFAWLTPSSANRGDPALVPVADFLDPNKGYVVNDACIVEVKISVQAVSSDKAP